MKLGRVCKWQHGPVILRFQFPFIYNFPYQFLVKMTWLPARWGSKLLWQPPEEYKCVHTSRLHSTGTLNIIRHNLYSDVIMGAMASQITSLTIVYSTVYSGADQRKHQSSASLAFVRGIHRWPVYSPHKWPVTRKMFPFDDVIIFNLLWPTIWIVCLHDVLLICNLDSHNISLRKWLQEWFCMCPLMCISSGIKIITNNTTSHERHGISKHQQIDCLFSSMSRLARK